MMLKLRKPAALDMLEEPIFKTIFPIRGVSALGSSGFEATFFMPKRVRLSIKKRKQSLQSHKALFFW